MSAIRTRLSIKVVKQSTNLFSNSRIARYLSTSNYIIHSGLPDVDLPKISIPELLIPKLEQFEKYTALECGITGRKYTYGDVRIKSKNFSKALRKNLKLEKGDVVAMLLPNLPEFPIAFLGILQAGLVVTTMNPIYTPDEIHRQLSDSNAKAIITINECWKIAKEAVNLSKKKLPIITVQTQEGQSLYEGAINFKELTNNPIDYPEIEQSSHDDLALLPYSSGTTGLPKGVQLTHYNLNSNLMQNASSEFCLLEEPTSNHQDVFPSILPMFHIYGMGVGTIYGLYKGSKIVTLPKFTPNDYIAVLKNHKPQVLFLVPPIVLFMTSHKDIKKEDLQSVRATACGAAPLGALDEEKFLQKAGKHIHMIQGYGLTETSPTVLGITIRLKSEKKVAGAVGIPLPNTYVKVIDINDPSGKPLGPNTPGELLIKGPQVMKGYHNRQEETKNAFLDGWFRTGDIAYYNDDKIFYITDRLKELIKVKGFQVPPAELEEIIRDFPNVEEAAVIGVPHPAHGEVPRAYILPKKNSKIDIKELDNFVSKKVAEYKRLSGGIAIVDNIPKNVSGKIMRRQLKLDYLNEKKI